MRKLGSTLTLAVSVGLVASAAAQDNLDGPYATLHGDLFGTNRIDIPAGDWSGGIDLAWMLDLAGDDAGLGLDAPWIWAPLTFDADGNLYWLTDVEGGTAGLPVVASVAPDGTFRWKSPAMSNGGVGRAGAVVGGDAVYSVGGGDMSDYDGDGVDGQLAAAVNKTDGSFVWSTDLDGDWNNDGTAEMTLEGLRGEGPLVPVLKDGVLYVALIGTSGLHLVQLDAADGSVLTATTLDPAVTSTGSNRESHGNMAYIDDAFGAGLDGLFFNAEADGNNFGSPDSVKDVFGIQIDPGVSASIAWTAAGGKAARASITYNPVNNTLYTHTWNDNPVIDGGDGSALAAYDPATGAILDSINPGFGHGFYDVGILSEDGTKLFAGGFDGRLAVYGLNPDGTIEDAPIPLYFGTNWHGEYRTFGNLAVGANDTPLVFTGTNSRVNDFGPDFTARMVVLDVSPENLVFVVDDPPIYIDDIEILEGATPETATTVYAETFETAGADTLVSALNDPAGGIWANASSEDEPEPSTVANPFQDADNSSGTVLKLDPQPEDNGFQGATWTFATEVGVPFFDATANDPQRYVIIRWKQYRENLTDNFFMGNNQDFAFEWDITREIRGHEFSEDTTAPLEENKWQEIELVYDFFDDGVQVFADGVTDTPGALPFFIDDEESGITEINFDLSHTALSTGDPPLAQYDTGTAADHTFTMLGGPLLGPDGKFYTFTNDARLIAVQPAVAPAVCGDANCDGVIDFFDIDPFVTALVQGQAAWEAAYTCDYLGAIDTNKDGVVDFFDIDPFVTAVLDGSCP